MSIDRPNAFVFPSRFFVQLGVHDMLKSDPSVMNIGIGQLPAPSSSLERGHGVGGQETEADMLIWYLDSAARSSRLFEIGTCTKTLSVASLQRGHKLHY